MKRTREEALAEGLAQLEAGYVLTIEQTAAVIGKSKRTVWRMIREGSLRALGRPKWLRIPAEIVKEYLREQEQRFRSPYGDEP